MRCHKYLSFIIAGFLLTCLSAPAEAVNVNQSTAEELQTIKGIGPKTAERIIEERERAGDFLGPEDLVNRVKGLGEKSLNKIRPSIEFSDGASAQPVRAAEHSGHTPKRVAEAPDLMSDCMNPNAGRGRKSSASPKKKKTSTKSKNLASRTQVAQAIKNNKALVRPKYIEGPYLIKPQHADR